MRGKTTIQRSRRMMLCAALFTIYFSLFINMSASAQDSEKMREVYAQAESAYKVGRIEQTRDVLLQNLSNFQGSLRLNV